METKQVQYWAALFYIKLVTVTSAEVSLSLLWWDHGQNSNINKRSAIKQQCNNEITTGTNQEQGIERAEDGIGLCHPSRQLSLDLAGFTHFVRVQSHVLRFSSEPPRHVTCFLPPNLPILISCDVEIHSPASFFHIIVYFDILFVPLLLTVFS